MLSPAPFPIRKLLTLTEAQNMLIRYGVWNEPPSRPFLVSQIEEGKLDGRKERRRWYIFEDSLWAWVKERQTPQVP